MSGHELAAEFVVDVDPDDVIKGLLGRGEAELEGSLRDEIARPTADDADNGWIRHPLDPRHHILAGDAVECCDLLADGRGKPGHVQIAALDRVAGKNVVARIK